MTDKRIAALEEEIAALKASQPTPIDHDAASRWKDEMHAIAERRALQDAKSFFTRGELQAMRAAAPDDQVRAIAMRDNRAPLGPSSQGIVPTSQPLSQIGSNVGLIGTNRTGWRTPPPIKNGLGQGR